MRAHVKTLIVLLGACVVVGGANAQQDVMFVLEYDAPATCPDARGFADRIVARLGRDPFGTGGQRLRLNISETSAGYSAAIHIDDAERRIGPAASCGDLVSTVAATIAIFLDPFDVPTQGVAEPVEPGESIQAATAPEQPAETEQQPALAELPTSNEAAGAVVRSPVPASPPLSWALSTELGTHLRAAPGPMLGAAVALEMGGARWHVSLGGRFRHSLVEQDVAAQAVQTAAYTAELQGCAHVSLLHICAKAELGRYSGRAEFSGIRESEFHFTLGPRVALAYRAAARLELRVAADLALAITRPRLLMGETELWTGPVASIGIYAGATVFLGRR